MAHRAFDNKQPYSNLFHNIKNKKKLKNAVIIP